MTITATSRGPIIVVGRPRSGTTLLRNLLDGHRDLAFTAYESHFIPGLLARYGAAPRFRSSASTLDEALSRFKQGQLYRKGVDRSTFTPDDDQIRAALSCGESWTEVIQALCSLYANKDMSRAVYWGDKTPRYLKHLDLLFHALPDATFIHIIRDPRDQALSERAIWGKSVVRSSALWQSSINSARRSAPAVAGRYHEARFESLVTTPEAELTRLCQLIGIEFDAAMVQNARGSDELGQMVGASEVSSSSVAGRRSNLTPRAERAIAAYSLPLAAELGYNVPAQSPRVMRGVHAHVLAAYDRAAVARYHVATRDGVRGGVKTMARWSRERPGI